MQCPNCQKALQGEFKFCPYCGSEVVKNFTCHTCHKEIDPSWVSCPYCGSNLKAQDQRLSRQQPPRGPEQNHPPYDHGRYYGSSSAKRSRKRKGFLGRIFSS